MTLAELTIGVSTVSVLVVVSIQTWSGYRQLTEQAEQVNTVVDFAVRYRREITSDAIYDTEHRAVDGSQFLRIDCHPTSDSVPLRLILDRTSTGLTPASSIKDVDLWKVWYASAPESPSTGSIRVQKMRIDGSVEIDRVFNYARRHVRGHDSLFNRFLYYDRLYCDDLVPSTI